VVTGANSFGTALVAVVLSPPPLSSPHADSPKARANKAPMATSSLTHFNRISESFPFA
jgi:hypothetical protein